MLSILFDIVVQPIIYLIELAFSVAYQYRMADLAQERERARQDSMRRVVDHIKATFAGDEQYMVLSAYYAERGYRPAQALVGTLPLLLQVPFFMAAYTYLSGLSLLKGASFLFLPDLGSPDALLSLGGVAVNVMPVAMTLLNFASTAVYTRGLPLRDKAQAYGLAALFLVLLYDSPSGLVFYWTCNQLFSLGKNVFMKLVPDPGRWALLLADACALAAAAWLFASGAVSSPALAAAVVLAPAAMVAYTARRLRRGGSPAAGGEGADAQSILGTSSQASSARDGASAYVAPFFVAALLLTVLVGVLVPSAVIADSPTEFVNMYTYFSPATYVLHTACVSCGFFVLWLGIYFMLSDEAGRARMALFMWCACGAALVDYFLFPMEFGALQNDLTYLMPFYWTPMEKIINLAALAAVCAGLVVLWKKARGLVVPVLAILTLAIVGLSVPNFIDTESQLAEARANMKGSLDRVLADDGSPNQIFALSKTGKNVVVLFLDRALSGVVPYVFDECPQLERQFDGFVYYPNTVSFSGHTNFSSPSLYGGYEYTPEAMNARSDESIPSKHNEALLVMPTIFSEAGYKTTVVNPPYAGDYAWIPDLSLYDSLEQTSALNLTDAYIKLVDEEYDLPFESSYASDRRFFFYSIMRVLPRSFQGMIYDERNYRSTDHNLMPNISFQGEWGMLHALPTTTEVHDDGNNFLLICNNVTHDPVFLDRPDYVPAVQPSRDMREELTLDGRVMSLAWDVPKAHYHCNAAALLQLGRWFDWMREQGVYDNTRIVIVSDHGQNLGMFADQLLPDGLDLQTVNPVLMFKDFGAAGYSTSDEFMTIGDTPVLATEDAVGDGVATNPFTGVPLTSDEKHAHDQLVTFSDKYDTYTNNGNVFDTADAPWYAVHDNIFDLDNWTKIKDKEE